MHQPTFTNPKVPEHHTRQERQQFDAFMERQQKRAAKRALHDLRAKSAALSDSEKIASARKRREDMRLARIAAKRGKRERVFFVGEGDVKPEPEIIELVGHAEVKVR